MQLMAAGADVVRPLRQEILRPGQAGEELVFGGDDHPDSLHTAVILDGAVVGVASVMRDPHPHHPRPGDWRIRGMATRPELRNRGIGTALLAACEAHAREHGATRLWCNARVNARAFYERGGLIVEGGAFEIPTIGTHYLMSRPLDGAIAVFDEHAAGYEALRRRLVPSFDAFYDAAVAALALAGCPLRRVLDLGAGTGLLARAVAREHPDSELVLLDGSAAMLEQARAALGDRARYVTGELAAELPPGPWDAVVSALAIHHLEDRAKRDLFRRVHAALSPGGVFVNAEQVKGPTTFLDGAYTDWHERRAHELGASAQEWADARERMRVDRLAGVEEQLAWLRQAGFPDADCLFKDHRLAVLFARRAG